MTAISIPRASEYYSIYAIPFNSYSGKFLLRLQEVAYLTDSVFKKYVFVPLVTLCVIPFSAVVDCAIRLYRSGNSTGCFHDVVSHIVSVVALPFRLISYWFCQESNLLAVRHSWSSPHHLLAAVTQQDLNPRFLRDFYQKRPLAPSELAAMNPQDRALYRIGYELDNLALAKRYWEPPHICLDWRKIAFDFAVEKNCLDLINDLMANASKREVLSIVRHCIERGTDDALSTPLRQRYQQQAKILLTAAVGPYFSLVQVGYPVDCLRVVLECALDRNRVELFQDALPFPPRVVDEVLIRGFESIFEKWIQGENHYAEILRSLLGSFLDYDSRRTLLEQKCRQAIELWMSHPQCVSDLSLMRLLFSTANYSGSMPENLLFSAIKHRDPAFFQLVLEYQREPGDICAGYHRKLLDICKGNPSLLEIAFSKSKHRLELVQILKKEGCSLNQRFTHFPNLKGHTPLTYAAAIGDLELVRCLERKSAQLKETSVHVQYKGKTALQIAREGNHEEIGRLLDPDPFGQSEINWKTFFRGNPNWWQDFLKSSFEQQPVNQKEERLFQELSSCSGLKSQKAELAAVIACTKKAQTEKNLWQVFGAKDKLDQKQLNQAYKRVSLIVHPDKNPEELNVANSIFKTITSVKDYLLEACV